MEKIRVGISGINPGDNPGPGIGVARSLKENNDLPVEIIGLAYDAMEPGVYMDWIVDKSFLMPYPSAGGREYIDRLIEIKKTHGLDLVIPNLDAEIPIYIKYKDFLARLGIRTYLPTLEQFRLRGKDKLNEVADRIGVRLPQSIVVQSYDQFKEAITALGLPVMVKGIFYGASLALSAEEAECHYFRTVSQWGFPVIVQQVVTGEHLNVVGLGNRQGQPLGLTAIKKLGLTSLGKIWTGVTVRNEPMLAAAERFIREYKWCGPFELECILSDGEINLIEINPRFPAWLYFATGVGVNLPERLLRDILNLENQPLDDYEAGMLLIRYSFDLVTDMTSFQELIAQGETL